MTTPDTAVQALTEAQWIDLALRLAGVHVRLWHKDKLIQPLGKVI